MGGIALLEEAYVVFQISRDFVVFIRMRLRTPSRVPQSAQGVSDWVIILRAEFHMVAGSFRVSNYM